MAFVPLNTTNSLMANFNNANNAIRDLNNKKIKNDNLSTTPGEPGGVWKDWTPTLTNLSGGTINYAKYTKIGKTVFVKFKYTLTGAGVSGNPTITLPFTATNDQVDDVAVTGTGAFLDTANQVYLGILTLSTTAVTMRPLNTAATNGGYGASTSATNPFTFGNTDTVSMSFVYEAA